MSRTGRVVRGNLKIWWPELLVVAILIATGLAPTHGALFLAVFCACMIAIGWALGFRHRHMPIFEVIRGINDRQKRMEDKLDQALATDGKPVAEVRHLHSI